MKNGIVHKRERKKRKRRGREGFRLEGERESDPFISSNWNPPRGILRFPKERSPRLSLLPLLPGENTRGIIVPSDPISSRDNSFPEDVELSRYESHWTLQLPPPLFFYPHKSDPLLPPLLAEFFPPRVFERERRSCENFHSRNASGKRKIVVVI